MLTTEEFNAYSEGTRLHMLSDAKRISGMLLNKDYACWQYTFEGILIEVRCEVEWNWPIVEVVAMKQK